MSNGNSKSNTSKAGSVVDDNETSIPKQNVVDGKLVDGVDADGEAILIVEVAPETTVGKIKRLFENKKVIAASVVSVLLITGGALCVASKTKNTTSTPTEEAPEEQPSEA